MHSQIVIPLLWTAQKKKTHPNSAPQKSCTYSFRNAHYLDAGWPTQTQKFFLQTQMQGFMLFSLLLFRVETEEFRQRLYLYVFLTTWWQSLTKVVHHKLRTAIMSPSLEYCRMPASTPIWFSLSCRGWGLQSSGHSVSRLELFLGFDWQWVCCVDYSSLGWCIPHIQCQWRLYILHLLHLSVDGQILSGSKLSPKTILIYTR